MQVHTSVFTAEEGSQKCSFCDQSTTIQDKRKMLRVLLVAVFGLVVSTSAQQSNGLPTNCVLNEKRGNPLNPHTFYYCRADGPTLMKCPEGMTFDSTVKDCTRHAPSSNSTSTFPKVPGQSHGWGSSGWTTPSTSTPRPYTGHPVGSCPAADGEESVYLPSTDCRHFYQCSNGVPYLMDCPANLFFNAVLNVCDYPNESGCTQGNP